MAHDDARGVISEPSPKDQPDRQEATDELIALAYRQLRRIARDELAQAWPSGPRTERSLVNEAYARLVNEASVEWQDRSRSLIICARAMRRAIVEHMRRHSERRHADAARPLTLGHAGAPADRRADLVVAIDDALAALEEVNARAVRVVECRYFAGLTEEETAAALGATVRDAQREWLRARAWLLKEIGDRAASPGHPRIANHAWVDAVFDEALTLPAETRPAFLERCSAAPGGLRASVEELLRLSADPAPGLDPGDLGPDVLWSILAEGDLPVSTELAVGQRAGTWRVVRAIGRDRRGTSYLVEPTGGRVRRGILTLVRPSDGSDSVRRQMPGERRVLGSIAHPNIARFLDGGETEDGRMFFVTEFIEGRPIDRYCDEELLTIGERLDLFLSVCTAVQYAHRKLVVHGDITPASILVTPDRQVKLLDLGVARLLATEANGDDTGALPMMVGAPEYASPEQARGEPVAVASDVYQLGLLLYELLTGERAQTLTSGTREAVVHAVCDVQPSRPSARARSAPEKLAAARRLSRRRLSRRLAGNLDAIVLHALRKEPDRRYPSVSGLRSDVQRHRMRQPLWARKDSFTHRTRTFLVRHRAAIGIAAGLLIVAAAALPGPALQRLREARAGAQALQLEHVLSDMLTSEDTRLGVRPPDALQHVERAEAIARTDLGSRPGSQARLLTLLGGMYGALGRYDRSIAALQDALALHREHVGDGSLEVADTLERLGVNRHALGRFDEAEESLRQALLIRQIRLGTAHDDTLRTTIELGALLHARGQLIEAEQMLRRVVAALRPEVIGAAEDAPSPGALPRALHALAGVLRDRGVLGESATLYNEAVSIFRQQHPQPNRLLATASIDLSRLFVMRSELDLAEAALADGIGALRRLYVSDHPVVALALVDHAHLRIEQGRLDEAGELLQEAERVQEQRFGRVHPIAPRTRANQAELARRRGDVDGAVALARQAVEEFDRLDMPEHPAAIDARVTLGEALLAIGEPTEAIAVFGRALSNAEKLFVEHDGRLARLREARARAVSAARIGYGESSHVPVREPHGSSARR